MIHRFENLSLPLDESIETRLTSLVPNYSEYRILKKSIDARRGKTPRFIYTLEVAEKGYSLPQNDFPIDPITSSVLKNEKPIIIGAGPAGLFAALRLTERGIPCRLFERGSKAESRIRCITRYWRYGELDSRNNVCFGEGGAGLYSDGKLITRIKSPHIPYVMHRLVKFGAPEEIMYLSNPHVGSDRIRRVIPQLRDYLIANGCELHYETRITDFHFNHQQITGVQTEHGENFNSPFVVLATGHSANDIFSLLYQKKVMLSGKSFAIGVRIEHPQSLIDQIQYRQMSGSEFLGAANYRLTHHNHDTGIGVYTFCMCPGGYVLSSSTESDAIVCNGMSNFHRNSNFANSAVVVSIQHDKLFANDPLGGLKFRRELEQKAFNLVTQVGGKKELPAQNLLDFLNQKKTEHLQPFSSLCGALPARIDQLLPQFIYENLHAGLTSFGQTMRGFLSPQAQLFALESRTSCPLRVDRHAETLESISHSGLYPAGEGAGYAGGITSSACDGISIAEKIAEKFCGQKLSLPY